MSDLIDRLRGKYVIPVNDGAGPLDGSMEFIRQFPTPPIHHEAADALKSQAARIAELEASLADAKSRAKVYSNSLLSLTPGGSEYFNGDCTVDEQACTNHIRERFIELHKLKCEKVRAKAESHSSTAQPTAAPACEGKEELTDILRILDAAPNLPLDSCTPEELQEWTTAIKSVLVHIGVSLSTPAPLESRIERAIAK